MCVTARQQCELSTLSTRPAYPTACQQPHRVHRDKPFGCSPLPTLPALPLLPASPQGGRCVRRDVLHGGGPPGLPPRVAHHGRGHGGAAGGGDQVGSKGLVGRAGRQRCSELKSSRRAPKSDGLPALGGGRRRGCTVEGRRETGAREAGEAVLVLAAVVGPRRGLGRRVLAGRARPVRGGCPCMRASWLMPSVSVVQSYCQAPSSDTGWPYESVAMVPAIAVATWFRSPWPCTCPWPLLLGPPLRSWYSPAPQKGFRHCSRPGFSFPTLLPYITLRPAVSLPSRRVIPTPCCRLRPFYRHSLSCCRTPTANTLPSLPSLPSLVPSACSTWVTINTATRRLAKLPEDVRTRFLRFGPSGDV